VAPTPTFTPAPTSTRVVIVVTATPTATAGPTHTPTPSPTATAAPGQTRLITGKGGTITSAFDLLGDRPVRIQVSANSDPHFGVYLRFASSCVRQLVTGGQVYWRHPSSNVCDHRVLPNRSVRVEVIARADTEWAIDFDMAPGETQLFAPLEFTGTGNGYIQPLFISHANVVEITWQGGPIELRFMRLYTGDGQTVDGLAYPALNQGTSSRVFDHESQTYMPYVTAAPGVEWTVKVR
jgi:hypothetical protein